MKNINYEIIDLSVSVGPDCWEPTATKRKIINHQRGADILGASLFCHKRWLAKLWYKLKHLLGYGIDHYDFPDKKGLSYMQYSLTTHTGTHMDAPFHYGDVSCDGKPAQTISELPLSWCYGNGVLIDCSNSLKQSPIKAIEIQQYLLDKQINLNPLDIVLIYSGGDKYLGSPKYFTSFRGLTRGAIKFLVEQGIKIIGIDSFSFDAPFRYMLIKYLQTKENSCLWPVHLYGRENPYYQLEKLTNLNKLKNIKKFKVACFPIKLKKADAAWCRVVAIVEKHHGGNKTCN